MRKSTALKKNLLIKFAYWRAFVGTAEQLSMKIGDIEICKFGPACIRIIESIFNHKFENKETVDLVADTFKVDNGDLYINNEFVTRFDYTRMWLINEAFAKVTHYSISVNECELAWTYSWSQDWHVQNLSGYIGEIDNIKPEELNSTLEELKKKYGPQITHNHYFHFEIFEYRGKEFNRRYGSESIGLEPDNFDEKIRKRVWKD